MGGLLSVAPGRSCPGGRGAPARVSQARVGMGVPVLSSGVAMSPDSCAGSVAGLKPRNRRLLVTTKTEEKAIAAPASMGFSRPAAASGRAATLYAKAQNRLPLIVPRVRRERRIA